MEKWHGTAGGYTNHKCRCDQCRTAWNLATRERKARRRALIESGKYIVEKHGVHAYFNMGCRCEECKNAARENYRRNGKNNRIIEAHGGYDLVFSQQKGLCAICLKPPPRDSKLVIDHDHSTGHFRGLLCHGCNTGLGKLGDNREGLLRALEYLKKNS